MGRLASVRAMQAPSATGRTTGSSRRLSVGITDIAPAPTPSVPAVALPSLASSAPAEELPVTGAPFAAQTALGLLLVSIGTVLRKKAQMA